MKIQSTKSEGVANCVNVLLYGRAGIGKTVALSRAPAPLILSAEAGLLSLSKTDTPYAVITSVDDLREAFVWLQGSDEAKQYQTVCIDSLSEICDIAFEDCKRRVGTKPAELYPELRASVRPILASFRTLDKHFIATARETVTQTKRDDVVKPAVVGNKLSDDIPYMFDIVLHYTLDADDKRIVYSNSDSGSIAKDRTCLLPATLRDTSNVLANVINTIKGVSHAR